MMDEDFAQKLDDFFTLIAEFFGVETYDVEFNMHNFRVNLYDSDDLYEVIEIGKDMYTIVPIGKGNAFEE